MRGTWGIPGAGGDWENGVGGTGNVGPDGL